MLELCCLLVPYLGLLSQLTWAVDPPSVMHLIVIELLDIAEGGHRSTNLTLNSFL